MNLDELKSLASILETHADLLDRDEIKEPLRKLLQAAETVGRSWSQSSLGYHSLVYYKDFKPPQAGARFSREWGLMESWPIEATIGDWREYSHDDVIERIFSLAGDPKIEVAEERAQEARKAFELSRPEILSILTTITQKGSDAFLKELGDKARKVKLPTQDELLRAQMPSGQLVSRDSTAVTAGVRSAPHQTVIAQVASLSGAGKSCRDLATIARQAATHIGRSERSGRPKVASNSVFIGHGRSAAWRELKDFVHERLRLPYEEFNRVPVAGITNVMRLSQILDTSAIALLVLTAEDEQATGSYHARLNVVHEVGLFQGRLGFSKAIVVLEENCEQFSNIEGLGQIRFPAGMIGSCFEEVRRVLEREGLLT